jgi:hypothetical protein
LESAGLRHVVTDLQRLNIVAGYRELRPDTLTVDLEDGAFTSTSTDYNLGRLFLAYRGTTEYRSGGTLELLHNGRRVGLYTKDGLVWEAVR